MRGRRTLRASFARLGRPGGLPHWASRSAGASGRASLACVVLANGPCQEAYTTGRLANRRWDSAAGKGRPGGLRYAGQAAIEFALLYAAAVLPLTFMLVYVSQMLWVWHSVIDFNRAIAQFAATHCWEADSSGSNVISWATSHVPPMIDQDQFQSNAAGITVAYYSQAADGTQAPFDSSICNGGVCVPDLVSVSVTNYQFKRFSSFFRLGNVTMPPFTTVVPMESGGYQDASGVCVADATQ
jgi:hypothetical protein